jgi:acyl-CoA thioesterase
MSDEKNSSGSIPETLGQRRVVFMEGGRAQIEYEAGMHMCHSGGVVQGGFITGWIDAAMAHAVISRSGFETVPMSLEIKVTFFAPARPGTIIAEAWIEQSGKTTCFAEGLIKDQAGNVLAKGTSTIRLLPRAKVQSAAAAAGHGP